MGGRSYAYMQPPFTQHLFGTTGGFLGGVAFAPNGDVWADNCVGDSGSLHRFAQGATYQTNGTTLHYSGPRNLDSERGGVEVVD